MDVAAPPVQVQHHIGHPLAGAVIGVLSAAPGGEHGQALGIEQVLHPRRDAGGVQGGVFQQPDQFVARPVGDGGGVRLHGGDGGQVVDRLGGDGPSGGAAIFARQTRRT